MTPSIFSFSLYFYYPNSPNLLLRFVCKQQYRFVMPAACSFQLPDPFLHRSRLSSHEQILSSTKPFRLSFLISTWRFPSFKRLSRFLQQAGRQESKVISSPGLVARLIYIGAHLPESVLKSIAHKTNPESMNPSVSIRLQPPQSRRAAPGQAACQHLICIAIR